MLLCRTVHTGYGLDYRRLLAEAPADLLADWRDLYELEPWGEERSDRAMDQAIAMNLAAHGIPPRPSGSYMPFLKKEEPKPQSQAEMKQAVRQISKIAQNLIEARKRKE